jgi:3-methyladenine DNA glycosylase/8-oxoguanine DNA glycosylase
MVSAVTKLPQELGVGAASGNDDLLFPTPEEVLRFSTTRLERICRLGYRAEYMRNVAKHFRSSSEYRPETRFETLEALSTIKGLGPYSINHLAVLLGDHERMPIDSEVRAFCRDQRSLDHGALHGAAP